jgi:hypothetical protein
VAGVRTRLSRAAASHETTGKVGVSDATMPSGPAAVGVSGRVAAVIVPLGAAPVYFQVCPTEILMTVKVWQQARPKGRPPRWAFRVTGRNAVVFESAWVAIRYAVREDASWLALLIDSLVARGTLPGRSGHPTPALAGMRWDGDPVDDCRVTVGDMCAHAEHLHGPHRGGAWYCSVSRSGELLFHTADLGIQPRNGAAARWLCELVMYSALLGDATNGR